MHRIGFNVPFSYSYIKYVKYPYLIILLPPQTFSSSSLPQLVPLYINGFFLPTSPLHHPLLSPLSFIMASLRIKDKGYWQKHWHLSINTLLHIQLYPLTVHPPSIENRSPSPCLNIRSYPQGIDWSHERGKSKSLMVRPSHPGGHKPTQDSTVGKVPKSGLLTGPPWDSQEAPGPSQRRV